MNALKAWHNLILSIFLMLYICDCAYVSLSSKENSLPLNSQENAKLMDDIAKNNAEEQSLNNINTVKISDQSLENNKAANSATSSLSGLTNTVKGINLFFSNIFFSSSSKKPTVALQNNEVPSQDKLKVSDEYFKIQTQKPISLIQPPSNMQSAKPMLVSLEKFTHDNQISLDNPNLVKTISMEKITKVSALAVVTLHSEMVLKTDPVTSIMEVKPSSLFGSITKQTESFPLRINNLPSPQGETKKISAGAKTKEFSDQIVYITITVHSHTMSTKKSLDQVTSESSRVSIASKHSNVLRLGMQAESLAALSQNIIQNSILNIPSPVPMSEFIPGFSQTVNLNTGSRMNGITTVYNIHLPELTTELQTAKQGWWNDEENLKLNYYLEMGNVVVGAGYIVEEVVDVISGLKVTEYITSHFTSTYIMTSTTTPYTLNVTSFEYVTISNPTLLSH